MIEVTTRNNKIVYISTTEDCGENEGGLFCMVHNSPNNDEYFDYFTIPKEEYKEHKDNLKDFFQSIFNK